MPVEIDTVKQGDGALSILLTCFIEYLFDAGNHPRNGQRITCHYVLALENGKKVGF